MKSFKRLHIGIIFLRVILCLPALSVAADALSPVEPSRIILFVSKNIRPYLEAADGMTHALAENPGWEVEVFNLDKMGAAAAETLVQEMRPDKRIALVAAIGPEAVSYTWGSFRNESPPRLYSLILNPEKLIGADAGLCGIPLNIPAHIQLELIHEAFDSVKRVGVF
jgi:hypothetical protein